MASPRQPNKRPQPDVVSEATDAFAALEGVTDLRRFKSSGERVREQVDTARLLAVTEGISVAEGGMGSGAMARTLKAVQRREQARPEAEAAATPFYLRRSWLNDGPTLWLFGITAVLAVGLITLIVLMLTGAK